jgi:uncharacterized protein YdcH (DUF465 family)
MFGEIHDLAHELPEFQQRIQELKSTNSHFATLMEEHDEIDRHILRCETEEEVHADDYVNELKKKRLALKDELFQILRQSQ